MENAPSTSGDIDGGFAYPIYERIIMVISARAVCNLFFLWWRLFSSCVFDERDGRTLARPPRKFRFYDGSVLRMDARYFKSRIAENYFRLQPLSNQVTRESGGCVPVSLGFGWPVTKQNARRRRIKDIARGV